MFGKDDCFAFGIIIGAVISLLVFTFQIERPLTKQLNGYKELTNNCEETLPRNKTCQLIAVPKDE